jgi:hypothetical protein
MSTTLNAVNQTWQIISAGPLGPFAISALTHKQYYQLVELTPGVNDRGHVLSPGEGVNVELTGTDNLWVRTANTVNDQMAVTS